MATDFLSVLSDDCISAVWPDGSLADSNITYLPYSYPLTHTTTQPHNHNVQPSPDTNYCSSAELYLYVLLI